MLFLRIFVKLLLPVDGNWILIKEWVSFFLRSWGMNWSLGQTNRVNREAILRQFVCSALGFIPHEPRKKTLIPYIYNVSNKDPS